MCKICGKTTPLLVQLNESVTITSEILATLDVLNVIPRDDKNISPFLLIDGHKNLPHLIPFLEYINTSKDH